MAGERSRQPRRRTHPVGVHAENGRADLGYHRGGPKCDNDSASRGVLVVLLTPKVPGAATGAGAFTSTAACPTCHERRMDALGWLDDETVCCSTCGTRYESGRGVIDRN